MNKTEKPIGTENARRAAERFILDRFPYATVAFEGSVLKTDGIHQFYEVAGYCYCRLITWPNSIGIKNRCEIKVDASSADIVGYRATEHVLSS